MLDAQTSFFDVANDMILLLQPPDSIPRICNDLFTMRFTIATVLTFLVAVSPALASVGKRGYLESRSPLSIRSQADVFAREVADLDARAYE